MKPDALLVDSGFSAAPLYHSMAQQGWEVGVVGNNPGAFLPQLTEHRHFIDYSCEKRLADLVAGDAYTALVPGCTDASYMSCAKVAEASQFPGIDSIHNTERLLSKAGFRELCQELDLPPPATFTQAQALENTGALIVKPVDAYSGRGISELPQGEPRALASAIDKARAQSPTGRTVIEEFVSGCLFSSSVFIRDQRPVQSFLVEEVCSAGTYAVSTSRVITDTPARQRLQVEADLHKIAKHLGLVDGLLHVQWIEGDGAYWLIEMTRRCPGDLYARLIQLSTGFNYAEAYVAPFIGAEFQTMDADATDPLPVWRFTVRGQPGHRLESLEFSSHRPVLEYHPLAATGGCIDDSGRAGILFCKGPEGGHAMGSAEEEHRASYHIVDRKPGMAL